jgi:hypothetical protein
MVPVMIGFCMTPFNSFVMAMHYRFDLAPTAQGFARVKRGGLVGKGRRMPSGVRLTVVFAQQSHSSFTVHRSAAGWWAKEGERPISVIAV